MLAKYSGITGKTIEAFQLNDSVHIMVKGSGTMKARKGDYLVHGFGRAGITVVPKEIFEAGFKPVSQPLSFDPLAFGEPGWLPKITNGDVKKAVEEWNKENPEDAVKTEAPKETAKQEKDDCDCFPCKVRKKVEKGTPLGIAFMEVFAEERGEK